MLFRSHRVERREKKKKDGEGVLGRGEERGMMEGREERRGGERGGGECRGQE